MNLTLQEILEAALQLSEDERIVLAGQLLESVTPASGDAEWTEEWSAEIMRRWNELESGAAQALPWSEVDRQLREMIADRSNASR
jgi:putative addiction module component (TIGR02574 family)